MHGSRNAPCGAGGKIREPGFHGAPVRELSLRGAVLPSSGENGAKHVPAVFLHPFCDEPRLLLRDWLAAQHVVRWDWLEFLGTFIFVDCVKVNCEEESSIVHFASVLDCEYHVWDHVRRNY
ncbi:hypothetical protein SRHO_G00275100 [Serrasalmus rhombeus]